MGCLFVLFMISFAVQKLLNFVRFHLFSFAFIFITVGGKSKKLYVTECSAYIFLCFIVSSLTFRSLIHFELIFVYGVRE